MNRVLKSDELDGELPDPRSDASWQARLDEARARRAVALAEKARNGAPQKKRRLKPWEEQGVVIVDETTDTSLEDTPDGLGFHQRVDAMRGHAAPDLRGSNRVPDAGEAAPQPEEEPAAPAQITETPEQPEAPRPRAPAGTVNDFFADPAFDRAASAAREDAARRDEASPSALLLRPEPPEPAPSQVPAWRKALLEEVSAQADPVIAAPAVAVATAPARKTEKRKRHPALYAVLVFAAAVAVGPIWQMTRPVERGPLVYTLSAFALEPALGLTAPMFVTPRETRPGEWQPESARPPRGPLAVARPVVPARVAPVVGFATLPDAAPAGPRIILGSPPASAPALADRPAIAAPAAIPAPPLGPDGVADRAVRDGTAALAPLPRPAALPSSG